MFPHPAGPSPPRLFRPPSGARPPSRALPAKRGPGRADRRLLACPPPVPAKALPFYQKRKAFSTTADPCYKEREK